MFNLGKKYYRLLNYN